MFEKRSSSGKTLAVLPFLFFAAILLSTTSDAVAQIGVQGSDFGFDVATWNVEWFGSPTNGPGDDERQVERVADIIRGSHIDVWGLQEVANEGRFTELLGRLGADWQGQLATDSGSQRLAWIFNVNVLQSVTVSHVLTDSQYDYAFAARPPLMLSGIVSLADTSFSVRLFNVHMKAFMDRESWERRVQASSHLKSFIDSAFPENENVVVLGDFNDGVSASYYSNFASPYLNFVWDTARYSVPTLTLETSSEVSYIGFTPGSMIDHILFSDDLAKLYRGDARVYAALNNLPQFVDEVSDHLPVVASFGSRVSTGTDVENNTLARSSALGFDLFPNPTKGGFTMSLAWAYPTRSTVEVVDVLGRTVSRTSVVLSAGTSHVRIDLSDNLMPGLYVVRLMDSGHIASRLLVVQ